MAAEEETVPQRAERALADYEAYDHDDFAATLNDWRWFGRGMPPSWYTGGPWGH